MNLAELTIRKIHEGLKKKEFSALELCEAHLNKIKKENKEIFAFLTITENSAKEQAKKVDEMISSGKEFPLLTGVPCAIKDNILVENFPCTAGSKILENYIAPYDATVVEKLKKQGAIILGKTNLDEFGMGASTENSAFGPTRNPHDLTRVPGGSSGGSAAAVAADLSCYALGSDTGSSVRQPASFCGIVGLKPTYGAVSRCGLIAFASSLDQIGPMTKTVGDCKIVFDAIRGKDEMDSTSIEISKIGNGKSKSKKISSSPPSLSRSVIENLRIGIPKEYFIQGIDPDVERIVKEAVKKYEKAGAKIEEISLPHTEYALPCYYIIAPSEASANLARYEGIKYGYSAIKEEKRKIDNLLDVYLQNREVGFGNEVKRRIMLGIYALSSGYYEAYYLRAQKIRTKLKEDFNKAFKKVDVIFTPVSPTPAFKLGEKTDDPLTMYLCDILTVAVNLTGLPALSLPVGKSGDLPVGLQIIGKPFEENIILEVGEIFEKL